MTAEAKNEAPESPFDPGRFLRLGGGGDARPGAKQVALVPGGAVTVLRLDLPAGVQGAAREKVARRQVADLTGLGAGVLDVRPFHGPDGAKGWTRVLTADAAQVADWRARAGAGCRAVLPDYLALPTAEGLWTVAGEGGEIIARLGPEDGFAAPGPLAGALLETAWEEADESALPKAVLLLGAGAEEAAAWAEAKGIAALREPGAVAGLGLPEPKTLGHGELAFDLRRDPQAARARLKARVLPWRWPVLAGLAAAGLWAAGQILAIDRLEEQRRGLAQASATLVREHFVPQGPILDIRTQVSRALAARQAGAGAGAGEAGLLDIFGSAAEILAREGAVPGLIYFTPQQGLEITAKTEDFAALDRLVAALDEAGLRVEVAQSRSLEAGGAEGRLRLAAQGAAGKEARP